MMEWIVHTATDNLNATDRIRHTFRYIGGIYGSNMNIREKHIVRIKRRFV